MKPDVLEIPPGAIKLARTQVNPEQFGTVPDWGPVFRELTDALKAAGHPAGG
jgi:hypothetical protein